MPACNRCRAKRLVLADTLEVLDLSANALHSLREALARLPHLRVLFCSDNRFTPLPKVLGRCAALEMVGFKANRIIRVTASALPPALRGLILTNNCIAALPDALGHRPRLQKADAGRPPPACLAHQPGALAAAGVAAPGRQPVRARRNALPAGLLALPHLAWLAHAGKPFNQAREQQAEQRSPAPTIAWSDLQLQACWAKARRA